MADDVTSGPTQPAFSSYESTNATGYTMRNYVTWTTPEMNATVEVEKDSKSTGIHPRLYFKYVKSKLSLIESTFLKHRMNQLEKMVDEYSNLGQEALSDECIRQFITISRESAILACGFNKFVTAEHVDKFKYQLRGTSLKVTSIKNFARPIPKVVTKKIQKCIDKKLFDDYVIFHLDNKAVKETEKEKVERERDPIVFGKLQYSDKFYFIADWEDEFDDLRLSDIIKKLSLKRKDVTLSRKISPIKIEKK